MTAPDNLPIKYAGWLGGPTQGWWRPGWGDFAGGSAERKPRSTPSQAVAYQELPAASNSNFAMPVPALAEPVMPMTVQTSTIRVANDGQARESANPVGTATGHPAHDGQCGRADSRGRHGNTFPKGRWS